MDENQKTRENREKKEDTISEYLVNQNEKEQNTDQCNSSVQRDPETQEEKTCVESNEQTVENKEDVKSLYIELPRDEEEAQAQAQAQPARSVKRGRSLIPRKDDPSVAPQSFVDVPDYGYVGIDGSFQSPF